MNSLEIYSTALEKFKTKNFDESLKLVDELKTLEPTWKKPYLLEAYILREQGRTVELLPLAEKLLSRLDIALKDEKFLMSDALNIMGMACVRLGMPENAVKLLRLSAQTSRDNVEACTEISNALFAANNSEKFSRADFDELYDDYKKCSSDIVPFEKKVYNHEKIRVGFLSGDFRWHAAMAWSWELINDLDKNFFETYLYSSADKPDNVTEYLRSAAKNWRDINKLTDEEAAKIIRDDEIDILFDLSGHTSGNRLRVATYRPATVQICGIGYMNSTGLDCFDYFLSDVHCAGDESWFTEKLIHMPQTHFCYNSQLKNVEHATAPPCLRNGYVTFGCFNNFSKVTDSMLAVWKKILDRVPKSRIILKHQVFDTKDGKKYIGNRLKKFGFKLSRVDMRGYSDKYIFEYNDMDIALDTFPYTGGVTTCEAFWMGVPVVSLYGSRHGTRFGLSMLTNVGLPELAVDNVDDYISRAVMLANDTELLTLLRRNLRGMMKNSPLMDGKTYIRNIEKVFAQILVDARPPVV
ncbi:MAG: hypothetical protein IKE46_02625 [Selenomonadaceae bacterium]|nr:hypothetical protein [Selenomonadaceae bacterium]